MASSITVPSLYVGRGLRAPPGRGRKFHVFCFLSVTLWNDKVCAHDFAINTLKYRNEYDTLGYGKVCGCEWMRVQLCLYAARWRHHRMLKLKTTWNFFCSSKATEETDSDEILHISVYRGNRGLLLFAKLGSELPKGLVQEPTNL